MKKLVENILFGSKWLLTFFYLGLIIGLLCYALVYAKGIYHLVVEANIFTREAIMLEVLELVDMVMIANLIKMIITGSYNSSVSKEHGQVGENVSSGLLKIKMSTSLIGVSSIHLLQTFINSSKIEWEDLNKQLAIHTSFLVGSFILALIEYLHDKGESLHNQDTHEKSNNPNTSPASKLHTAEQKNGKSTHVQDAQHNC